MQHTLLHTLYQRTAGIPHKSHSVYACMYFMYLFVSRGSWVFNTNPRYNLGAFGGMHRLLRACSLGHGVWQEISY